MTPLWWEISLVVVWVAWGTQAVLCVIQARKFSRHLSRNDREGYGDFAPPAVVFVPFKGIDVDAVANLHGLFQLDYPDYRLLLIVECDTDPAHTFLTEELAKYPTAPAELVIAGQADPHTGQKVHNLLAGLRHLDASRAGAAPPADEVWVFADSDAVPNPQWLRNLVLPLMRRESIAVTTGYRWMVPARGPRGRFKLGGQLASVINSGIATFAAHRYFTFAWGGSMAMLAETAQRGGLTEHWTGALSDDFQVTRMARELDQRIYFLPECIVESPVDMTVGDLAEFARRQYLITRTHEPWFFLKGWAVVGLYVLGLFTTWWGVLFHLVGDKQWIAVVAGATLMTVGLANQVRAWFRRRAVRELLGFGTFERLTPALRWDRWGTSLVMLANFALLTSAWWGRTITWRGKRYRLRGPRQVERLA